MKEQEERKWRPGWYADRLHAEVRDGAAYAVCGFRFPRILPNAKWFHKKMDAGIPKCKKCLKALGE